MVRTFDSETTQNTPSVTDGARRRNGTSNHRRHTARFQPVNRLRAAVSYVLIGTLIGLPIAACDISPVAPDPIQRPATAQVPVGSAAAETIRFYEGTSVDEEGRPVEVVGILEVAPDRTSASIVLLIGGQRQDQGRVTVVETAGGWLHEYLDENGAVLARYVAPTNELASAGQPGAGVQPKIVPAAVIAAVASAAATGAAVGVVEYTIFNFRSWTVSGAANAAFRGAIVGAALGKYTAAAERFLKPVLTRFVRALGAQRSLTTALRVVKSYYSEIVDAIRRIL